MSKRRLSVFAVVTADWMKYRPYPRFSPQYDGFYLQLANQVFEELNDPNRIFRSALNRERLVELAVVLSSWFEDYANEIGLWSTYLRKNKELHGFALPFFDLSEHDPEALNPEDLAYLIWHYSAKTAARVVAPDNLDLMEMAETLVEMFDEALDEAPGTDFYDDYLRISENIPFFELKSKLNWMAFKNYLCGPEFHKAMGRELQEFLEGAEKMGANTLDTDKLIYGIQDDFHYKKSSSFLALTMPEWLAEVVNCPESLRDDIRLLFQRIIGEFVYEGNEGPYYLFRHLYTKRLFKVRQASVEMKGIPPGELVFTSIVCWRGEWWVSGTLASYGNAEIAQQKAKHKFDPSSISFYAYTPGQQQNLREMAIDMEDAYLEFFGERMVFFKNNRELQAALEKQNKYYNQTKTKADKKSRSKPSNLEQFKLELDTSIDDLGKGLAIFFEPGEGTAISSLLPLLAHQLAQQNLSVEHSKELFFNLFHDCSPATIRFLLDKYGAANLVFPVITDLEVMPYLEFLMRFYNPDDFREVLPNSTLMMEG